MKYFIFLVFLSFSLYADTYYVISNPVYTNIYSVDNKIPDIGIVHLTWDIVKKKMKRTNYFHTNKLIPKTEQASNDIYSHSGMDKGHFSASNADWDNNKSNRYLTFSFTNIVPQYPKTNRYSYKKVENYGRHLTKIYKSVFVVNIAVPSNKKLHGVTIPSGFIKIFMFKDQKQCFVIPNNDKNYSLDDMKVSCSRIKFSSNL